MKVLTIQRSKWRRGGDADLLGRYGKTRLLNEQGLMCCLGFDAIACGLSPADILDQVDPETLLFHIDLPAEYRSTRLNESCRNSAPVSHAIGFNDDSRISDKEREVRVRTALMELGWDDVVFID